MASHTAQKITLSYDEREDRLSLAIEDTDGQLLALWLTQRLANRLARALVGKLDSRLEADAAAAPRTASASANAAPRPAPAKAALQGWEQAAAMAQFQPSAPVPNDAAAPRGLIHSVDLSDRGNATLLAFRWSADHAATLRLEASQLRQWLTMLYQNYLRAEWATAGVWPAWLAGPAQAGAGPAARALLH